MLRLSAKSLQSHPVAGARWEVEVKLSAAPKPARAFWPAKRDLALNHAFVAAPVRRHCPLADDPWRDAARRASIAPGQWNYTCVPVSESGLHAAPARCFESFCSF